MPTWVDDNPDSPLVFYDNGDGSRTPFLRDQARQFGFAPPPNTPIAPTPAAPPPKTPPPPLPIGQAPAEEKVQPLTPRARLAQEEAQAKARALAAEGDVKAAQENAKAVTASGATEAPAQNPAAAVQRVGGGVAATPPPTPPEPAEAPLDLAPVGSGTQEGGRQVDEAEMIAQSDADERRRLVEETNARMLAEEEARAQAAIEEKKRLDQSWTDYQTAVQKAADHKVDPDRKWKSLSTGRKIGVILMAAISGIGSALKRQGDRNPALDLIMAEIERDVALQMAEKGQLERTASAKRTAFDDLGGRFKTHEAEFQARKAAALERFGRELDQVAAKTQSAQVRIGYEQMRQDADLAAEQAMIDGWKADVEWEQKMRAGEVDIGLKGAQTDKTMAEAALAAKKAMGGGGGGGGKAMSGTYRSIDDIDKKYRGQAVLMADGSYVIAPSKEAKAKADEAIVGSRTMVQNIDRALAKVQGLPGFAEKVANKAGWTSEDAAVIAQELTQLQTNGKNYYTLGALSEGDLELMKRLGGDPDSVNDFIENHWAKLTNWREGIVADASTKIRQYVARDVDTTDTFGAAPEKPRGKTSDEAYAELTARPTFDGPDIVAGPNYEDARANLRAAQEAFRNEGKTDADWKEYLTNVKSDNLQTRAKLKSKIDSLNDDIAAAEKKLKGSVATDASKEGREVLKLRARRKAYAAQMNEYSNIIEDTERLSRESLQRDDAKKKIADAKKKMLTPVERKATDKRKEHREQVQKDRASSTGGIR